MTIGQLAKKSNTDAQTIRYYERLGLVAKPRRTESNYRVYDTDSIARLTFIRRAKEIGFSLNDIKALLGMADGKVSRCVEVQEFAVTRLSKIQSQIADLKAMEKTLSKLVRQCATSEKISECPILETLTEKT
jgi:MerR family transcriptional regulator, mercuric resistance operon regulatory protein